ncbi:hypothetical protein KC360_g6873 [Hortaea werneckii]|nr:hypothetical protein KC325_g6885 [Hortaea werneckii]KAI7000485.1 hypothetical protein KC359_g1147 [Hortaea werneckii]KAI7142074.1 hypothetical protein KC344_g7508 [Hortaea werneckii]KAI7170387.1 hypothetical protein KC360_g6873 [Hortaea werneckii]
MAPPPTPVTLSSKPRDASKKTPADSAPKGPAPMTPASPTPKDGSVIPVKRAAGEQSQPEARRQRQRPSDVRQGSSVASKSAGLSQKVPRDPFGIRLPKGVKRAFAHVFENEGQIKAEAPVTDAPVPVVESQLVVDVPVSIPAQTEAHDSLAVSPPRIKSPQTPADDKADRQTGPVDETEEVSREGASGSSGNVLNDAYSSPASGIGAAGSPPSGEAGIGDVVEDEFDGLMFAEEDTVVDLTIEEPAKPSDSAYKRKVNTAMANKVEFAQRVARLEDDKAAGKNIFAAPLLEIAAFFSKADAEREEVIQDPNLSDPTRQGRGFPEIRGDCQMQSMTADEWFRLEPRDDGMESWLDEGMIANIVVANLDCTVPKGYFATPEILYNWLGTHLSSAEQRNLLVDCIRRWKESRTMPDIVPNELPLINLPSSAPFVVMPYNTGGHWITVKLEPNKETGIGKIIFYDSLDADSVAKKVRSNMPVFAELVGLRPELRWNQKSWKVEARACTIQHNSYDCGPLTAENCRRLLCGEDPVVKGTEAAAHKYGITLRYEALCKLFLLLMGRPFLQQSGTAKKVTGGKPTEAPASRLSSVSSELTSIPGESDDGDGESESEDEDSSTADGEAEDGSSPYEDEQSEYEVSSHEDEEAEEYRALESEEDEQDLALQDDDSLVVADESKIGAELLDKIALEDDDNPLVDDEIQSGEKPLKSNETEGGENLFVDDESEFEEDLGEDDEPIASKSSGIRERLCDVLEEFGPMTIGDLASRVEEHVPPEVATAPDYQMLLERLLERSASMFKWEWEQPKLESKLYWVHPGQGRSLSTHSRRRLLTADDVDLDGTKAPNQWDVAVAIVRTSRRSQALDSKLAYVDRCGELLSRAVACSDAPGRKVAKYGSEAAMPDYPFWTPYFREDLSSTKELLEGPRRRDKNFRTLLGDLNAKAKASRHPVRVCLIGNGWDGISTANDGWTAIVEAYPFLVLSISLAFHTQVAPAGIFQQGESDVMWAHYSLSLLGKMWQTSLPPKQLWSRSQVHHEQFLYICQAINASKVDSSLAGHDRRFRVFPSNKLARVLTKVRRNTFQMDEANSSKDENSSTNTALESLVHIVAKIS